MSGEAAKVPISEQAHALLNALLDATMIAERRRACEILLRIAEHRRDPVAPHLRAAADEIWGDLKPREVRRG